MFPGASGNGRTVMRRHVYTTVSTRRRNVCWEFSLRTPRRRQHIKGPQRQLRRWPIFVNVPPERARTYAAVLRSRPGYGCHYHYRGIERELSPPPTRSFDDRIAAPNRPCSPRKCRTPAEFYVRRDDGSIFVY